MLKVIRETAIAGKTIYRNVKVPSGPHSGKRSPHAKPTREAVRKNNFRLAVRNLTLLLNANFDETCAHVTLTYKGDEPSREEAKAKQKKFIRDLRKRMKAAGQDLKYVVATEYENKRIHHHMVISTQDIRMLNSIWKDGFIHMTPLDDSGNYRKLAEYLVKETEKTFRREDSVHKQRYSSSRNLIRPAIKREYVGPRELSRDPKPLKGYHIPKDEIRRYEHPVTGLEHLEYIMIADGEPRKRWSHGRTVSGREYYRIDSRERQEHENADEESAEFEVKEE